MGKIIQKKCTCLINVEVKPNQYTLKTNNPTQYSECPFGIQTEQQEEYQNSCMIHMTHLVCVQNNSDSSKSNLIKIDDFIIKTQLLNASQGVRGAVMQTKRSLIL